MTEIEELKCANCGVSMFMPADLVRRRYEDGQSFYCVNGHSNVFSEPKVKKLEKQIERLERQEKWLRENNQALYRSINGYKGQLGRMRKLIVNLREEIESEKEAHWHTQQALATEVQENRELNALNLYDLVGDVDHLRSEMVDTIKERNSLREQVTDLRAQLGAEIANVERIKLELRGEE